MPAATSGYARLAQADEEYPNDRVEDDALDSHTISLPQHNGDDNSQQQPAPQTDRMLLSPLYAPQQLHISPATTRSHCRRSQSHTGIDLQSINARFERWINRFKLKKNSSALYNSDHPLEIQHSVFQPPEYITSANPQTLSSPTTIYNDPPGLRLSDDDFERIIDLVHSAINQGIHPSLIAKGSSGSYFARNPRNDITGVFKPKDEEPYASKNPKWSKWIHRNLFPCFFGRACLIPNLSYVSEAAAYVLDTHLRCNLVPYTGVVALSSISFHYDFWDRRAYYRKKKYLPEKLGSFQVFLNGYQDATSFFRKHPWPDQRHNSASDDMSGLRSKTWTGRWRSGSNATEDAPTDDPDIESQPLNPSRDPSVSSESRRTLWTPTLQYKFRLELEKLVILDYIMRNTDRGLDNWMIKMTFSSRPNRSSSTTSVDPTNVSNPDPPTSTPPPVPSVLELDDSVTVRIGAIDNSLSFPWKHPDEWRSFPYGWLFLPDSLIGLPFCDATRQHFLPLLTSKTWWSETQAALRKTFKRDADFKETMFAKQMAIIKGQAWNVVETLKCPDHGPLELTRRARVCVWDDVVEVPVVMPLTANRFSSHVNSSRHRQHDGQQPQSAATGDGNRHNPFDTPRQGSLDELIVVSPSPSSPSSPASSRSSSPSKSKTSRIPPIGLIPSSSPPSTRGMSVSMHQLPTKNNLHSDRDALRSKETGRQHVRNSLSFNDSPQPQDRRVGKRLVQRRRLSASARLGWDNDEDDEDEADLGFATNESRAEFKRKVIIERLENVKSKHPFFTCC